MFVCMYIHNDEISIKRKANVIFNNTLDKQLKTNN